jgi:arginyl-tRNA synthetase
MSLIHDLKHHFFSYVSKTFSLETLPHIEFSLNCDPDKQQFGDMISNAAMILAKPLSTNPRTLAQTIATGFTHPALQKIEVAGPGFLNFYFTHDAFKELAQDLFINKDSYFQLDEPHGIWNIEFVSANPTGPLHLGHGRGGIIGDVLGNVMRFLNFKITKEHYINDAGSQMQKLGMSLKIRCQQACGQSIELPEESYKGEYLVALAQECIKEHGVNVLTQPDSFFVEYGYTHMLALLKKTLAAYGITFDVWFSEKILHNQAIEDALAQLATTGTTYEQGGALWFRSTTFGDDKDRVLRKADGSYTYVAADAAYLLNKAQRGFNKLILVLGQDHHSYPRRLEGIRQALGLTDVTLDCILYQLVSLKEDGQHLRMSKRAGRIIGLNDVIEEVGSDVARFFYLNRKADAHLEFDIDLALKKTDENPVYYLQYAFVRTQAILERTKEHPELLSINAEDVEGLSTEEFLLLKKIASLKELLIDISGNYQVHLLTYYLLDLANIFHNYYHHNRVLEPESVAQSRARLLLIILVRDTFDRCLKLIGISRPDKM